MNNNLFVNVRTGFILNLDIVGNVRGVIKDERVYSHPI